ncbi:hypothetical protein K0T92_14815 [Paenibacillus oenotherae]|uniref:Tyrosinase copper-binding domain-containing protein n=1 Tax=Paenibacillus oenotherae TaxID=1435645 RepID=A0ABS7D8V7_9BACL|nr:hypothetical protein [Paenibacillus oenotherae]MBW7476016.1 hypothetical protein [Paenibacillus oenotherae]
MMMSIIRNFPRALLEEHRQWHHANHQDNPANIPAGYGLRFLEFHRQFIARALQWYNRQGYNPQLVAPWQSVPEEIRYTPCYNRAAERRILFNPQSFATADELGRFIESSNIHGCIHQEAARLYNERELNDFDVAPVSTIFYNIHGMIDGWYRQWESVMGQQGRGNAAAGVTSRRKSGGKGHNLAQPDRRNLSGKVKHALAKNGIRRRSK